MQDMTTRSIEIDSEKDPSGEVEVARIRFGPHYRVEVRRNDGKVSFELVYTHHGVKVDASEVNGELERIINELRDAHPDATVD